VIRAGGGGGMQWLKVEVDGGGTMRWPKPIVVGSIHACGWGAHPCQFRIDLIGAGAGRKDAIIFIFF
jgi:hypothetical protein